MNMMRKMKLSSIFKCHLNRFDKNYKRKLSKKHSIFKQQ